MRIKQAYVGVRFFRKAFLEKYKLSKYYNPTLPSVFFGLYVRQQKWLRNHNATAVIVWAGTDVLQMLKNKDWLLFVKNRKNTYHIAISRFIENDLRSVDIPFVSLPIIPHDNHNFEQFPLGKSIYIYTSDNNHHLYGQDLVDKIKIALPGYNFITATSTTYSREELIEVYKKCFLGLRLTRHDGLSNTVIELGLMGRKVIWNGNSPNAIPYTGLNDIIRKINKEANTPQDPQLSKKVKQYITIDDPWLSTIYYKHLNL